MEVDFWHARMIKVLKDGLMMGLWWGNIMGMMDLFLQFAKEKMVGLFLVVKIGPWEYGI